VKVVSWNLLRRTGAAVEDVARLIDRELPDLLLMQEATAEMEALPELAGGYFHREPLPGRIHGLAAWSPHPLPPPHKLPLPTSRVAVRPRPRVAQLLRIANTLEEGPAAVIGDYNAIGPTLLPGFRDVGPREPTHVAQRVVPFRLDRCLVRELHCAEARALERGPSDHRPIVLQLEAA
jgi:endonuclease/exonuclease/phosphatase (EEP) superfamily protein YafD